MTFFFDNNLSHRLAKAMGILEDECRVEHLQDTFDADTDDVIWLEHVGRNGLVLITRDRKIRKRRNELEAYRRFNVGAFILTGKSLGKWREIKQLIFSWEEIKRRASDRQPPYAFQVPPRGSIKPLGI